MSICTALALLASLSVTHAEDSPGLKGTDFDATAEAGLVGEYFQWKSLKKLPKIPADKKPFYVSVDPGIDFNDRNGNFNKSKLSDNFLVRWTGILRLKTKESLEDSLDAIENDVKAEDQTAVPDALKPREARTLKAGRYRFFLASDDGARLWIGDKLVVDHDGLHGAEEKSGEIDLIGGDYPIRIEYFEAGGGAECRLMWHPAGGSKTKLPANILFHKKGTEKIAWDEKKWQNTKVGKAKPSNRNAKYVKMNYGPALATTFKADWPDGNTALKGLVLKFELQRDDKPIDEPAAEVKDDVEEASANDSTLRAGICFDTELLRYSAAWTGGWIIHTGIIFDGRHGPNPGVDGDLRLATQNLPGWDKAGELVDPREIPHGPLPRDYARYKGAYYHGNQVVISYVVGDTPVLELPGIAVASEEAAFTRDIQYGPSKVKRTLVVCDQPGATGSVVEVGKTHGKANVGAANLMALLGEGLKVPGTNTAAAAVAAPDGASWEIADTGRILLHLPPVATPVSFKIVAWNGTPEKTALMPELVKAAGQPADISQYTRGGPIRWEKTVETKGSLGTEEGPYAVDTIEAPYTNPYDSWIRFGGFDFFSDGTTAALSTWSGDVWVVSGVDDKLEKLTWKRFATGLFHPLGLRIIDDQVYTLGRDQITRLHDLNNDGEADFYECFNNDVMITDNFHEFAFSLQTDAEGRFYFAKGGPVRPGGRGWGKLVPHHGCIMRVAKDGSNLEIFSTGSRAPNGICVGPNGEVTVGDNEGTWTPKCHISLVKKGDFVGVTDLAHTDPKPTSYAPHICWLPKHIDNSNGGQVWVPEDGRWGPLSGRLLHMSYGVTRLYLVDFEHLDGVIQGGVVPFKLSFNTGIMRGRFNTRDGQLYLCGLKGWQTRASKEAGFQRVRYTGKPVDMAAKIHYTNSGIEVTFNRPVAPESVKPENFAAEMWNYKWSSAYGSGDYSVLNPGKHGKDKLEVASTRLSADGKTVSVELPQLEECMQWMLRFKLKTPEGQPLDNELYGTINKLNKPKVARAEAPPVAEGTIPRTGIALELESLLPAGTKSSPAVDIRSERMVSLFVESGSSPSPFLPVGKFKAVWRGNLNHNLKEQFTFSAKGQGKFQLSLNGQQVLSGDLKPDNPLKSKAFFLNNGANAVVATFESPAKGDAQVRLYWESDEFPPEPISMDHFSHDAGKSFHRTRDRERQGRMLVAKLRCLQCHKDQTGASNGQFAELRKDAPSFEGIGSRLNPGWIAEWLIAPQKFRPDTTMPQMFHGEKDQSKAGDIAAYLASLKESRANSKPEFSKEQIEHGGMLYRDLACAACHTNGKAEPVEGITRVPHDHLAAKWQPSALVQYLKNPEQHYKWTRMPNFGLSQIEAEHLAAYLLSQNETAVSVPSAASGDIARGKALVESTGCLNCHAPTTPSKLKAPALHEIAKDEWTKGCLAEKPSANAPFFGLDDESRKSLLAFAATDWKSLGSVSDAEYAQYKLAELRCVNCHSRDGQESPWTDIMTANDSKSARDDEDADEDVEDRSSLSPPRLTWVGEKLLADWMGKFISGHIKYKPRPWLKVRMPTFPVHAKAIADGLAMQHGLSPKQPAHPKPDDTLARHGRQMSGPTGFSCNACHSVGSKKSIGVFEAPGINFAYARDRLQKEYFLRWIAMPRRVEPDSRMPQFIEYGKPSPFTNILGGDANKQFNAFWQYLLSGKEIKSP